MLPSDRKCVLIVHAHPEPTSVTSHLAESAQAALLAQGHEVLRSDLYRMGWKAVFDAADFPHRMDPERLSFIAESAHAFAHHLQTVDVEEEQRKLLAADALLMLFPLWWYSMPAIMKGWVDRVWAYGLAYGYRDAGNRYRYGEGGFAGKRALLGVAVGGPAIDYGPRGINGPLDQLLFPITHGTLFFPGMQVLPTFAVYDAVRIDASGSGSSPASRSPSRWKRASTSSKLSWARPPPESSSHVRGAATVGRSRPRSEYGAMVVFLPLFWLQSRKIFPGRRAFDIDAVTRSGILSSRSVATRFATVEAPDDDTGFSSGTYRCMPLLPLVRG